MLSPDIAASFFLPPFFCQFFFFADTASVTSAIDLFFSTSIAFFFVSAIRLSVAG
jgi:hypothetical protein